MGGAFHQSAKAYFHTTELTFNHPKWMFNLSPRLGVEVLDFALGLVKHAAFTQPGIGAAPRDDLPNHFVILMLFTYLNTGVARIGIDRVFLAVK